MFRLTPLALILALAVPACAGVEKETVATVANLDLDRVVLYRNGVGYFERSGAVDGDLLTLKIRKDQVNDVLKSLTVVDKGSGKALSVSMPLDPRSWANAALATLEPGRGNLTDILDSLRGTWVTINMDGESHSVKGRILMVEAEEASDGDGDVIVEHRITVIDGSDVFIAMVREIESITFEDEELSLQIHRALDATAGEGMFQQVEVDIRLSDEASHDLRLSYVVAAPIWKPTYRVVLPTDPDEEALLQGWAVVDNTSGEDWSEVKMSLTSGTPIAFRYNMHAPVLMERPDLSGTINRKRAKVAIGETSFAPKMKDRAEKKRRSEREARKSAELRRPSLGAIGGARSGSMGGGPPDAFLANPREDAGMEMEELRGSTGASVNSKKVSGLTRYDLEDRVTVPDGSATMVAVINEMIDAEQVFLFRPGGSGPGYEHNPYRVVRFKNTTPYALEPGPISIYSGGSFVGEGISELIASGSSATIPFAVEPEINITTAVTSDNTKSRLLTVSKGTLRIESFARRTTTWTVRSSQKDAPYKVVIRQRRAGTAYTLQDRPTGTEDLPNAYLIPILVPAGITEASIKVTEQTPVRRSIAVWDHSAVGILESVLAIDGLDAAARKKIEPIISSRKEIADIDRRVNNLKKRQRELDQRANQTRANLRAIEKDTKAGALRKRLTARLEDFTREGDKLGREVVELTSRRLEKKINLDEALEDFTFESPKKK